MRFASLRKKHPKFIYEGFEIQNVDENFKVTFDFKIDPDIRFSPVVIFPKVKAKKGIENLVFNLGMIELFSYWKATCSPQIVVKAGFLDEEQIKWWKKLLIKGLGEFFYVNKIDFTKPDLIDIKVETLSHFSSRKLSYKHLKDRDLILIGGGKDSAVTLDSIRKSGNEFNCLLLNPTKAAMEISKIGGCKNPIIIKRFIDPKLLELNKKGYLNGHTPFSAYLAFLSVLTACMYGYKNIVVSNENESSEGNVEFRGKIINHQYSKSLEFEKDFGNYAKNYLSSKICYLSNLRDLNELQIARQFSKMEKYHHIFRSCNVDSKIGGWCGKCPKCLFTYIILYPFLGEKLEKIFGKNLLNDLNLTPIMEELLQIRGKFKPFECVGTKEEVEYALLLGIIKKRGKKMPKLIEKFKNIISILILGMGREGQVTYNILRKILPKNKIGTADSKDSPNYLKKIKEYDIIIKSPGIPYLPQIKNAKEKGKIITSATGIFFDIFEGKIIGITGTKGKSTTTSLIYEVLKAGGADVQLAGNIGKPSLALLEKLSKDSVVVYELSSFQLADLFKSPHIAVITNIYPEHLDWHSNSKNYFNAKTNITKYQDENDYLFYVDLPAVRKVTRKTFAKKKIFSKKEEVARNIAGLFNIPETKIEKAIENFKPLPHRLEFVAKVKGIRFYNDSLATNPYATIYGLNELGDGVETLIAGGFDRGLDYSVLGPEIVNSKIKNLILFPVTGEKIWKAVEEFKSGKLKIKKFETKSMEDAVRLAFKNTSSGKICLLSPASASFNMFKDYEDRGNQFKKWIKFTKPNRDRVKRQ